jgi:hypothetical protein
VSAQGEAKVKPAPVRGIDDHETPTNEGASIPDELKSKVSLVSCILSESVFIAT